MRYRTRVARDPYMTAARFNSKCQCGADIKTGERIFYYPNGKRALGMACGCGDKAQADFAAALFDESQY